MKSRLFKVILSLAMAVCMAVPFSVGCFAAEYEETPAAVATESAQDNNEDGIHANAIPLSIMRSGYLEEKFSGTTTGYLNGSFHVPYTTNVEAFWGAGPTSGDNLSGMFKMTVTGKGITKTIYLDASHTPRAYPLGNLLEGDYDFSITPYSGISGEYAFLLRFYAY